VPRPFLTACWSDLLIVSYPAPRAVLEPWLPDGLELDERSGQAYVSLVAFDFRECRVGGVRWPGLVNFPEVNLRFYVRERAAPFRRGVCFVAELVPSRIVAWTASAVYNEPYRSARMSSTVSKGAGVRMEHRIAWGGRGHTIAADAAPQVRPPTAEESFFHHHEWGFGRSRRGRALVYRVDHPLWGVHARVRAHIGVDFGVLYGPRWAFLTGAAPESVILTPGSAVRVFPCGAAPGLTDNRCAS
jgi:uncharacterized protein YqjF (DUF2071 family)